MEGKKPYFPVQTLISDTAVHMVLFETEMLKPSKRKIILKPRVWDRGQGVPLHLKECVCRGR